MPKLTLRKLTPKDETPFLESFRNFGGENGFVYVDKSLFTDGVAFREFLDRIERTEKGIDLPKGFVPCSLLFGFNSDGKIVGRISIRHELNDFLLRLGGHIGYGVVPQFRRLGFASEMLRLSLPYCKKELGLNRVLLTCDDDNVGSIKMIEANGGVLENTITEIGLRSPKRRYWIDL